MSATLGDNLVDDLVPVVDSLRADLYPAMGTRQYDVHLVRRRWSGSERGEGTASIVSDVTITPTPLVELPQNQGALHDELDPTGRDEEGSIVVSEVSLTYTEAELTGGTLTAREEFLYKVVDGKGQAIGARWYVLAAPPAPDREKTIGWRLQLRRVEVKE